MNKKLYNYAIKLLTRRDYSRYKLQEKLKTRSDDLNDIDEVMELLEEQKYLKEEEYARQRVQYWLKEGYNNPAMIQKAYQEKLPLSDEFIDKISIEIQVNPMDKIKEIFEKKFFKQLKQSDYENRQKIIRRMLGYFQRRGFDQSSILDLINQAT